MNEKVEAIKKYFMQNGNVFLAKQCKKEYIIYAFYANFERNAVVRKYKQHFNSGDLLCEGKNKRWKVNIPLNTFFDEVVYDLLNRGYGLEMFED